MKKPLVLLIIILTITGLVFLGYMLGSTMQPSDRAKAQRSQHDISTLKKGQYRIDSFSRDNAWFHKVLLIKDWDEKNYVYLLPIEKGKTIMPDRWWGWGYYYCSNFHPEIDNSGLIKKNGIIKCHDEEVPDWGDSMWEWSYNGSPVDEWGIEMYSPSVNIENGILYINH